MDFSALTQKLLHFFRKALPKSQALSVARKDLGGALDMEALHFYDRVRDWFVKEDPDAEALLKKYKSLLDKEQEDTETTAELKGQLKAKLKAAPAFAQQLAEELEANEARYFDTINKIENIDGQDIEIAQGSGKRGDSGKTRNEISGVKGSNIIIRQDSHNENPQGGGDKKKA